MKKLLFILLIVIMLLGNTLAYADPYALPDDPREATGNPVPISTELPSK